MNKAIVTLCCTIALLMVVEARPPKGISLKKLCEGNSTCEDAARACGKRMKDAHHLMKGGRKSTNHYANMEQCAQGLGIYLPEMTESGKYDKVFFGSLDEATMTGLKKCMMEEAGLIDASGLLMRETFKENVQTAFGSDANLLQAMLSAVETCPEPQDFKMMEFFNCMGETCLNNITF